MPVYPTAGDTVPRMDIVVNPGGVQHIVFDYTADPTLMPEEPGMFFGSRKTGTFDLPISSVGSISVLGDTVMVTLNAEDISLIRGLDYIYIDEFDSPNNIVQVAGTIKPWTGPGTAPGQTIEVVPGAAETILYQAVPTPGIQGEIGPEGPQGIPGEVQFADPGIPNVDDAGSTTDGADYLDLDVDAADRVLRGIRDDGTNVLPVAEVDRLTIGTSELTAVTPPSVDQIEGIGSGYLKVTLDADGRICEDALDEAGETPLWVLERQQARVSGLTWAGSPFDVVVCGGQSNAGVPDHIPADIPLVDMDARVFVWSDTYGAERLTEAVNRRTRTPAVAVEFARIYARERLAPGRNVLVVNAAAGGTGFSTTSIDPPPAGYGLSTGTWDRTLADPVNYYDRLVSWATTAMDDAPDGSAFVAFLWSQGESDSDFGRRDQAEYSDLLDDLVATLRTDLSAPDLPVVVGSLVPEWIVGNANRIAIEAALEDTPRRIERSGFAWGPEGLPDDVDTVHWSWQGQIARGPIFWAAFERARVNVDGTKPLPPQGLAARRTGGTVLVSWEHPPCRVGSFTVEYKVAAGSWTAATLTGSIPRGVELALAVAPTDEVRLRARTTNSVGDSHNTREYRT